MTNWKSAPGTYIASDAPGSCQRLQGGIPIAGDAPFGVSGGCLLAGGRSAECAGLAERGALRGTELFSSSDFAGLKDVYRVGELPSPSPSAVIAESLRRGRRW